MSEYNEYPEDVEIFEFTEDELREALEGVEYDIVTTNVVDAIVTRIKEKYYEICDWELFLSEESYEEDFLEAADKDYREWLEEIYKKDEENP